MSITILAMAATVFALITMGYFMLGSLPLLVLEHDTPLDARFIRNFFNLYQRVLTVVAATGAVLYGLAGKALLCLALALIFTLALTAHRWVVRRMDAIRSHMTATDATAIAQFKRLHIGGMALNVAQLAALALCLVQLRL